MEIKPGYKQTEIGVIPDDWDAIKLGKLSTFVSSGKSKKRTEHGEYHFYGSTGIIGYCDTPEYDGERILIARVGANAGSLYTVDGRYSVSDNTLVIGLKDSHLTGYIANYLLKENLNRIVFGSGQPLVTGNQLKNVLIAMPSQREEIDSIVEAISNVAALITSLEKLIEKKKNIKQGVMQELLTGKRRLPGFSGEWETKRLGDLCSHITTGRKDVNEGNPNGMYPFFTCSRAITYSDHFSFDTEAILIAGNGDVGTLHYFTGKFEAYQRTYVLTGFSVKARYLVHYLNMYLVPTLCDSKIGTSIPYIKIGDLINMPVIVPMDDAEVKHVISVIDDIELEIDMHVVQLKKHELLKQAMMQELLTGRIRLV